MTPETPTPEPDRVDGAAHPRETLNLVGQAAAEATFLDAFNRDRLHHGWLITGPRGIGKATLAWRIARFLLAQPATAQDGSLFADAPPAPDCLAVAPDHPVARRIAALSEPRLHLVRRGWDDKRRPPGLRTVITVEEVRRLHAFFALSAADGGRRVVIVDCADEMNAQAANALLKLLEEPPADATLLLVSHQPSALLPTIRSRCRELRLATLGARDMAAALAAAGQDDAAADAAALSALSGGSVGEAVRLTGLGGLALYRELLAVCATAPGLDRTAAIALADSVVGRGKETRFDLMLRLFELFLTRLARSGAGVAPEPEAAQGEAALMARLCPGPQAARRWAEMQQSLSARGRTARAVNLDPGAVVLDMLLKLDAAASRDAQPA